MALPQWQDREDAKTSSRWRKIEKKNNEKIRQTVGGKQEAKEDKRVGPVGYVRQEGGLYHSHSLFTLKPVADYTESQWFLLAGLIEANGFY